MNEEIIKQELKKYFIKSYKDGIDPGICAVKTRNKMIDLMLDAATEAEKEMIKK